MNDNRADETPGDFANLDDEFAGDPDTAVAPEELARIRDALHGSAPTLDGSLWERLLSTATDPATPDPGADLVTGVETGDLFDVGTPVDHPTAALDDLPDASPSDDTPDGDATDAFDRSVVRRAHHRGHATTRTATAGMTGTTRERRRRPRR